MKPEFKVGDIVTYQPFDIPIDAQVLASKVDDVKSEITYTLELFNPLEEPLGIVETSGTTIMESELFQDFS